MYVIHTFKSINTHLVATDALSHSRMAPATLLLQPHNTSIDIDGLKRINYEFEIRVIQVTNVILLPIMAIYSCISKNDVISLVVL